MTHPKIPRPYGLWDSPISPLSVALGMTFSDVAWDQDGTLVWLEGRSDRGVLVIQPADGQAPRDLNSDFSVRARLGYGGGDFTVGRGNVFFIDGVSGRIFRQPLAAGTARPVTPAFGGAASPALSPDGRWLLFAHTHEDQDSLAIVDSEGSLWPGKLVSGDDFYMQPVWHPDGQRLAWISWNFPNMPWDGTYLRLGIFAKDRNPSRGLPHLAETLTIAGDEQTSIFQPAFSPDGRYLAYVSDATGWWQIYVYELKTGQHLQLTQATAEHGAPAWVQGVRTYGFSADGRDILFLRSQEGVSTLWQINLDARRETRLPLDETYLALDQIAVGPNSSQVALLASGGSQPARVITFKTSEGLPGERVRVIRRSTAEDLPASAYSRPEPVQWKGMDGGAVHGLFYPPQNERFEGTGKPPLVVNVHGGPTSQVRTSFNPRAQFFTSRGYAVLEVNYRGSSGYGRAYRDLLRGNWGVFDVQDAVSGASALSDQGQVDGSKRLIIGGSAGGFTVLKALEDYPGFFKAGICLYGISNQFTAAADTHKFEVRYSDLLLGPLPEAAGVYRERSPIFFAEKIQDPLAIFHGENDQVVPRAQSDEIVASLQRRGVPLSYHVYPGEGHGFRKAETIEHLYRTIEQFLREYVIYSP